MEANGRGHQAKITISPNHYVLKDTTAASGEWEGMRRDDRGIWISHCRGYKQQRTPKGASHLYGVDSRPDAQAFERRLERNSAVVDVWLGGHTHTSPDDAYGGTSNAERKWGVWFVSLSALSARHAARTTLRMSRVWRIQGDEAVVRFCLHTNQYVPQGRHDNSERRLTLAKRFLWK